MYFFQLKKGFFENINIGKKFFLTFFVFAAILLNAGEVVEKKELYLDGEWAVFVQVDGNVIFKPSYHYVFHKNESWSIRKDGELPKKQGAVKYGADSVFLYVESDNNREEAIPAKILSSDSLIISNQNEERIKLLAVKKSSLESLKSERVCGMWEFRQKDLSSMKIRKSSYILHIKQDQTYEIKHSEQDLSNVKWAKGSWLIKNDRLYLNNEAPEVNFWKGASFFLYGKRLIYNQNNICIWAERRK